MILGIGIDAVDIDRFTHWQTYSDKKLLRIFSLDEIAYCRACPTKSAERFAVRFAAREAFYKALCQACPYKKNLFLQICRQIGIRQGNLGQPEFVINWQKLMPTLDNTPRVILSLTHTNAMALAWVVIENN